MTDVAAVPRDAATVLLLRDDPAGLQVWFLRRPARSSFAASAWVFPGGALDDADGDAAMLSRAPGFDPRVAAPRMHLDGDEEQWRRCAGLHVAAVREVFEETGILLGSRVDGDALGAADAASLAAARAELLDGASFAGVLQRHAWRIAPQRLRYVAHFITPATESRRYDTRFFACEAPPEQEAGHHAGEATESDWYTAAQALQLAGDNFAAMLPPTRIMCNELVRHHDAAAALDDLGSRPVEDILFEVGDFTAGRIPALLPSIWPPPA